MPESIRRRRQEIQSEEKGKKERGEEYDIRLLPSERVLHKREVNELAQNHYYGKRLTLVDFE
jgi:hypothetical protein